jgi:hypothetical protein
VWAEEDLPTLRSYLATHLGEFVHEGAALSRERVADAVLDHCCMVSSLHLDRLSAADWTPAPGSSSIGCGGAARGERPACFTVLQLRSLRGVRLRESACAHAVSAPHVVFDRFTCLCSMTWCHRSRTQHVWCCSRPQLSVWGTGSSSRSSICSSSSSRSSGGRNIRSSSRGEDQQRRTGERAPDRAVAL